MSGNTKQHDVYGATEGCLEIQNTKQHDVYGATEGRLEIQNNMMCVESQRNVWKYKTTCLWSHRGTSGNTKQHVYGATEGCLEIQNNMMCVVH